MPSEFVSIPVTQLDLPPAVRAMAERERLGPARTVWLNEVGGLTFAFTGAGQYVKWAPHHAEIDERDLAIDQEHAFTLGELAHRALRVQSVRPGGDVPLFRPFLQLRIVADNLRRCYEVLVRAGFFDAAESQLVVAWCDDLEQALA